MSALRLHELESGQSAVARKVLAAVPMQAVWTLPQIVSEVHRQGTLMEFRVVQGCLTRLKDGGLVRELAHGFTRTSSRIVPSSAAYLPPQTAPPKAEPPQIEPAKPAPPKPAPPPPVAVVAVPAKRPELDWISQCGELAAQIRKWSDNALALAAKLEELGVLGEEEIQKMREESGDLRRLKTFLKSLPD